ncbi:MAG: tRNA (adenosine(37)-N6)-threonylcarbamoyltransferase complex dimerization subunit type 1 TsaB [Chloroflexota bacterium]
MILAIDTSTHYASIALAGDGTLLAEHTWLAGQKHTATLIPAIQGLLASAGVGMAGLHAIGVALGPGSFNGLRTGLSTARGFGLALALPVVGVPTMDLIAAEYGLDEVLMPAGPGHVYRWRRGAIGTGPGEHEPPEIEILEGSAPDRVRHAGVLARLASERLRATGIPDPAALQPIYVHPPRIHAKAPGAPALAGAAT